ncbi:unnamed protein product, partial [Didymodactylos carnosus]
IATVLEIAIDWAAKHQCFTKTDRNGNRTLLIRPEVFFERALRAMCADIPPSMLPSLEDEEPITNNATNSKITAPPYSSGAKQQQEELSSSQLWYTYEQWTSHMIEN